MKLTWLGHACFLLEEDGYRIVLDPYTGVAGYPPLHIQAHAGQRCCRSGKARLRSGR